MLKIRRPAPALSLTAVAEDPRPRLLFGSFDAEREWEDAGALSFSRPLPTQHDASVLALDELLFPLCRPGDAVLIAAEANPDHVAYLTLLGFTPRFVSASGLNEAGRPDRPASIYECLKADGAAPFVRRLVGSYARFVPYAVTPEAERFCRANGIDEPLPPSGAVRKANSKAWSNELRDSLGCPLGRAVSSAAELREAGAALLESGAIIVKEEFGVAGRGSVVVTSAGALRSLSARVAKAEGRGLRVLLIVEPYVEKSYDFSCHFFVGGAAGAGDVTALMGMTNRGQAYIASHPLTRAREEEILSTDYLKTVEAVSGALSGLGYHGPACVDSLVTKRGGIIPVLEINARLSMGLLNLFLDRHLEKFGLRSYLTQLRLSAARAITFAEVLRALEGAGLLFSPGAPHGVIPLSAGGIEAGAGESLPPGASRVVRFACCVPYATLDEVAPVLARARDVLAGLGHRVLS